ncbi:MAG: NosD domain-containing protein [Thiotrichales bacterium]
MFGQSPLLLREGIKPHPAYKALAFTFFAIITLAWSTAQACTTNDIRYASSTNRIYIEQPVTCTLTDLTAKAPVTALELVDSTSAVWMLRSNIIIQNGGRLDLHSTSQGGDVDELRLASSPGLGGIIYIQPNYGTLDIDGPLITSWDEATGSPDKDDSDGRSHIKARSFLDSNGVPRESTINVNNAEIAYLGYYASESYGLVLKVKAKRDETHIFEQVDIFGEIKNSYIHDNYMGFYSWGAYGVVIDNNEVANNISYAIDPHDNSDYLEITNNWVHDNGNHGIICSQHCDHLTITGNTVERNRHGIMLHRSVSATLVENNISRDNADAGIALFESFNNTIRNNTVTGNVNGIRLSVGSYDNLFENNTVSGNSKYSLYFYKGSDIPDFTDGRNKNNIFQNNTINNTAQGFKLTDSDNNQFINNQFTSAAPFKLYQGVDNYFANNSYTGTPDFTVKGNLTTHGSSTIEIDEDLKVNVNSKADVTLTNGAGLVLSPDQQDFPVTVGTSGTSINLDKDNVGSSIDVTAIPLAVDPQTGTVSIFNPLWQNTNSWEAEGSVDGVATTFTASGLTPNANYSIKRDGIVIDEIFTDSSGQLSFINTLEQSNRRYDFLIEPGNSQTIIDLSPSDDSYVRGGPYSSDNYGNKTDFQAKNKGYNKTNTREGFIKFDLSGQAVPTQAILRIAMKLHKAEAKDAIFSAVSDTSWDEATLTYSNKPAINSELGTISLSNTSYQYFDIDVTSYVVAEKLAGRDIVSFALTTSFNGNAVLKAASKEASTNQPVLHLAF